VHGHPGDAPQAQQEHTRDHPDRVNDAEATRLARKVAIELVGEAQVVPQCQPFTGSENFAVMLQHCPGSYLLIGNGDAPGCCMVHNPGYDFNDDNVTLGAASGALLAERFLGKSTPPLKEIRDEQALPAQDGSRGRLDARRIGRAGTSLAEQAGQPRRAAGAAGVTPGGETAAHPIEPPSTTPAALRILAMAQAMAAVRALPARPMTARSAAPDCRIQGRRS
jgi:hypothetical protein